jgi:hypothetical protein
MVLTVSGRHGNSCVPAVSRKVNQSIQDRPYGHHVSAQGAKIAGRPVQAMHRNNHRPGRDRIFLDWPHGVAKGLLIAADPALRGRPQTAVLPGGRSYAIFCPRQLTPSIPMPRRNTHAEHVLEMNMRVILNMRDEITDSIYTTPVSRDVVQSPLCRSLWHGLPPQSTRNQPV